jgi:psp operon transcriptional activator
VTLPPLRAREGDVAILANHFGRRMANELEWSGWPGFSEEALAELEAHDWPGNVRELRNTVERAVYRWGAEEFPVREIEFDPFASPWRPIHAEIKPNPVRDAPSELLPPASDFRGAVAQFEKQLLQQTLDRHRHNQRASAKALGLTYDQIRHALRKHDLLQ